MKKINVIFIFILCIILSGCELNIEVHEHQFIEEIVPPTCIENGYTKYTCECGENYEDNIVSSKGHNYTEWELVSNKEKVEKKRVCKKCDLEEIEDVIETDTALFEFELINNDQEYKITRYNGSDNKIVVIPKAYNGKIITAIGEHTFSHSNIESIAILDNITEIESYAFAQCSSIQYVIIKGKIKSINNGTFNGCENLISVELPESITIIDEHSFTNCKKLTNINFPSSLEIINHNAFLYCLNLNNITFQNKLKYIGGCAFGNCESLEKLILPNSVETVVEGAFNNCISISEVTLSNSMTYIDYGVFDNCSSLTKIIITKNIKHINDYAFQNCVNLKTVHNYSSIEIFKGDINNGYVGYYATTIINYN